MIHRKKVHSEKVNLCLYFSEGNCHFGDSCWYSHDQSIIKSLTEYKCNIWEKIFKTKSVFMNHRKDEHSRNVTICRNAINGTCHFGMGRCWFKHNEMEMEALKI
jgi:hypothetical protein